MIITFSAYRIRTSPSKTINPNSKRFCQRFCPRQMIIFWWKFNLHKLQSTIFPVDALFFLIVQSFVYTTLSIHWKQRKIQTAKHNWFFFFVVVVKWNFCKITERALSFKFRICYEQLSKVFFIEHLLNEFRQIQFFQVVFLYSNWTSTEEIGRKFCFYVQNFHKSFLTFLLP